MTALTHAQVSYWHDSITLGEHTIAVTPPNAVAQFNLANAYAQAGDDERAIEHFTIAQRINPKWADVPYNLGNLYFDLNDFRLAQNHYEMAATVEPSFANVYFNLALVQAINNDLEGAVTAVATYQRLVSKEEGHQAGELLDNLKKSLAAAKPARFHSP